MTPTISNSFIKIFIFPKITPWGVVRKADGTLEYKHVLRFETDGLRDEFINENLYDEIGDYRQDLSNSPARRVDFMSDTRIHFRYEASENFNKIRTSDFCAVEIDGEIQFYALKVLKTEAKVIFFEGEIDLFFTYKIEFKENSQNFVSRAHLNRLTPDGTKFKKPNSESFPELLLAREPIEAPLVRAREVEPVWKTTPTYIYWVVVWYKNSESTTKTLFLEGAMPYDIYFFPISVLKNSDTGKNQEVKFQPLGGEPPRVFPQISIYTAIQRDPKTLKIMLFENPPFGFQKPEIQFRQDKNEFWIIETATTSTSGLVVNRSIKFEGVPPVEIFQITGITPRYDETGESHFTQQGGFVLSVPSLENPSDPWDPKLLTSQFLRFYIINYFQNKVEYSGEFMDWAEVGKNLYAFIVKRTTLLSLENPKTIYWFEEKNRNNLLHGRSFELSYSGELPLTTDLRADYLLKNKNQIATQKQQAQTTRDWQLGTGIVSALLGIGAVALAPFTAGTSLGFLGATAVGIGGASVGIGGISRASEAVRTHDYKLQNIDSALNDLEGQPQPVRVAGNEFYEIFNLPRGFFYSKTGIAFPSPQNFSQILNFLNMFGYQLNHLFNLNSLISNRKYWNFIQANDVFNSLENRVSSPQKQIISNAFASGITFWHYRNRQDWRGVLSYGRQNWETNYNFSQSNRRKKLSAPKQSETGKTTKAIENFAQNR